MKTNTATAASEIEHPPLACDSLGNLLALPSGTAAWRICRHTAGRPREISGLDKLPVRFPLTTTIDELVDLCGPDIYRVYALDDVGKDLGHVTTIDAERDRGLRNAADVEAPLLAALRGQVTPSSDLRFALEALTQIARINGEALRSVSQAQADWVKAIAMAKGLPRNVAFPAPYEHDDDDDEDDDDEDEPDQPAAVPAAPQSGIEAFLGSIAPMLPSLWADWRAGDKKKEDVSAAKAMTHLARIQTQLTGNERKFLEILISDEAHGEEIAAWFATQSVEDVVARVRSETAAAMTKRPPIANDETPAMSAPIASPNASEELEAKLKDKALAIAALLPANEQLRLVRLAPKLKERLNDPEVRKLVETIAPMPIPEAANWIREHLTELEKRFAS
jgi:hypothetical protein